MELAAKLEISPEAKLGVRVQRLWKHLARALPRGAKYVTSVWCVQEDGSGTVAMGIYMATNLSEKEIEKSGNEDLVRQVQAALQTDKEPVWMVRA